jgi:hypothetical protein
LVGLVHRDVSPNNLFLTSDGTLKLLDFGISKFQYGANRTTKTRTGMVRGTPSYISPEQILGKSVDRRADVFSLGVILYELLAGRRLFARFTDYDTLAAVLRDPIPDLQKIRAGVSAELAAAVIKALSRKPDERFESAAEFRRALTAAQPPAGRQKLVMYLRQRFPEKLASRHVTARLPMDSQEDKPRTVKLEELRADATGTAPQLSSSNVVLALPPTEDTTALRTTVPETLDDEIPELETSAVKDVTPEVVHKWRLDWTSLLLGIGVAVLALAGGASFLMHRGELSLELQMTPLESHLLNLVSPDSKIPATYSPLMLPYRGQEGRDASESSRSSRKSARKAGYLTVDAAPGVELFLDGRSIGNAPLVRHRLKAGVYRLVTRVDGKTRRTRVSIRRSREKVVVLK